MILCHIWGGTAKPAQITINNATLDVTSNLYSALQHLRFEGEDRIIEQRGSRKRIREWASSSG
jgi:hypothetical protein